VRKCDFNNHTFLCDRKFLSHKKRSAEDAHLAEWYFIAAQYRSGAENLASEILSCNKISNLFKKTSTVYMKAFKMEEQMDKKFADEMIEKFRTKYFGFALAKTASIDEAEELSSRIVCEAYITLRSVENIYNWEGYMYKIASNVYAKYVNERVNHKNADIDQIDLEGDCNVEHEIVKQEELYALKKELAWLCKLHRQIIIMHYYDNKKISQISEELGIPSGTVKWHLSDAKKLIKEGMKKMRTHNLSIEPIDFSRMGHDGTNGYMGDTNVFLNSRLRKNIVYTTYYEPKTVEEIAEAMGITPVYVEDEVEYLEEWGFLEKMPGNKYISNVFITDISAEAMKKCGEIDKEIARKVSKEYIPLLIEKFKDYKYGISIPEDDFNYFLWSLVPYVLSKLQCGTNDKKYLKRENYMIKRKDGGEYIAFAHVYNEEVEKLGLANERETHYYICGDMIRSSSKGLLQSWSISTNIDSRENGWEDNLDSDYDNLYLYLAGKLPKNEAVVEKYARLYDRGLIYNSGHKNELNVVKVKVEKEEDNKDYAWNNAIDKVLPKLPEGLLDYIIKKCDEKVEIQKPYYPKRMHALLEAYSQVEINRIMVLDELVEQGVLKPLSERQKKGVFQMIFTDVE